MNPIQHHASISVFALLSLICLWIISLEAAPDFFQPSSPAAQRRPSAVHSNGQSKDPV